VWLVEWPDLQMTWNDKNCSRTHERHMGNVLDSARERYIVVSVHYDTMGCYGSGVFAMACYGKNLNLLMNCKSECFVSW
jgi:hypothetical protein